MWAGDQMIVATYGRKRIAGYDPSTRRWTRYPSAPYTLYGIRPLTWTGEEVLVQTTDIGPDDERQVLLAFDVSARTWREQSAPVERSAHLLWAGDRLLAASGAQAAVHDPGRDERTALPNIPDAAGVIGLDWTGDLVIATIVSAVRQDPQGSNAGIDVAPLDPDTRTWTARVNTPFVWTGDRLVAWGGVQADSGVTLDDGVAHVPPKRVEAEGTTSRARDRNPPGADRGHARDRRGRRGSVEP